MATECADTLSSGQKCHPRENEPLMLPPLSDKCAILVAVTEVIRAASERRIKCFEARTLLMGLKFAFRLMTEIDETSTSEFESRQYPEPTQQEPTPKSADPARRNGTALTPDEFDQFTHLLQNATVQQLRHQGEGSARKSVAGIAVNDQAIATLAASSAPRMQQRPRAL